MAGDAIGGESAMQLVEIRDLDGPNLFLLGPAIKIEVRFTDDADLLVAAARLGSETTDSPFSSFVNAALSWLADVHLRLGLPRPESTWRQLDTPGHVAVAFSWTHRRAALAIAEGLARLATPSEPSEIDLAAIQALIAAPDADDQPLMIADDHRRIPVVGITGTNGKTTTTRLLAHILMQQGRHVGWCSSSGVYIDGREVLHGDYSGPSGARRVLAEPGVDVAVLEIARGGILLRGAACESNDVSVFTNLSADHLDLQGVRTVETLAEVKAVVTRSTRPEGTVVVNAADSLVMAATANVRAPRLLFSRSANSPEVVGHVAAGGRAIVERDGQIVLLSGEVVEPVIDVRDIPLTFGGRAGHMIENALAASGAAAGLGLSVDQIAAGVRTFHNSTDQNLGRLNVFDVGGVTAIMDFAHNEVGLELLIAFARGFVGVDGRVIAIVGTAGDRTPTSLRALGRIAAEQADVVVIKLTEKYMRGRPATEMRDLYVEGVREAGRTDELVEPDELTATQTALALAKPGDVIAIMCQEYINEIRDVLASAGTPIA